MKNKYSPPTLEILKFSEKDVVVNLQSSMDFPEHVVELDVG